MLSSAGTSRTEVTSGPVVDGLHAGLMNGSLVAWPASADAGRPSLRRLLERTVAAAYALTYDAIVRPFAPYQTLLDDIVALIERSRPSGDGSAVKVLDAACGTGTVVLRLAREGYTVVGVDTVEPLVDEARARAAAAGAAARFERLDLVRDALPGAGTYDVVVSMHTLYWHPDPAGFLAACQRSLRPGGHAVVLTYARPAHVVATFRAVWAREGFRAALHALRWLVPTAAFERLRAYTPHYVSQAAFHRMLGDAGFDVLESRRTFLADLSLLAWSTTQDTAPAPPSAAVKGEITR